MTPTGLLFVLVLLASAAASASIVAITRRAARAHGLLDRPNERSSHQVPTPRGGGVAIVFVTVIAIGAVESRGGPHSPVPLWPFVAGLAAIAALGAVDDIRGLSVRVRLVVQTAVAVFSVGHYGTITGATGSDGSWVAACGWVASIAWIVGLVNAYNFMDGIDGIAAVQGIVAAGAWATLLYWRGDAGPALISVALVGSCLGFLWFNWSPASIFMGDVGSGALGYIFALMPLVAAARAHTVSSVAAWFFATAVLFPFAFDTLFTLARRLLRRENVFHAHRTHLYQRLVIAGASHARVTATYALLSVYTCAVALLAGGAQPTFMVAAATVVPFCALAAWVAQTERSVPSRRPARGDS